MKILHLINALTIGGAQTLLIDLCISARNKGHKVWIATFKDGTIGDLARKNGIEVIVLPGHFFDIIAIIRLYSKLKELKPDIVHSHLFRATLWARLLCKITSTHLVSSIHGAENCLFHFLEKLSVNCSNHVVFPSNYLLEWYFNNIKPLPKLRCSLIYPGTKINTYHIAKKISYPVCIGALSRLHKTKGLHILLNACKILLDKQIDFKLLIAGEGKEKQNLIKLAKQLRIINKCEFAGEILDTDSFFETIDVFVAPSVSESFGIHLCEAMERGLPVVASNVGGMLEQIINMQNGLLFEHSCPKSLSECLASIITNPDIRIKLGKNARESSIRSFDRDLLIEKYFEIYSKISSAKRIHFAISASELGGGQHVALSYASALKKRGWEVSATCYGKPLSDLFLKEGISCSVTNQGFAEFPFLFSLLRELHTLKPKVISSHLNKGALVASIAGLITGIKTVAHVHGVNNKSYYLFSKKLVAVSGAIKSNLIKQGIKEKKVSVIFNNIQNKPSPPRELKSKLLNILIVAKLHPNKGHKWVFEAIKSHPTLLNSIRLDVVGEGSEKNSLQAICTNSLLKDLVTFHGYKSKIEGFYKGADVLLLPSFSEGMPLCILEAMSYGIPVIATNCGGIPEIIKHGYNGFLIKPRNTKELLEALTNIFEPETYKKLSLNSVAFYKKNNNFEQMIREYEHLLLQG